MIALFAPYHLDLKMGQSWKAQVEWHYSSPSAEIDQKDVEDVTFTVVTNDAGSYKISTSRKLTRTELPGVNVNAPETAKPLSSTQIVEPGHLFVLPSWNLDNNTARLSRLFDFGKLPAAESWQIHSELKGLPDADTQLGEISSPDPRYRVWRWRLNELGPEPRMTATGFLWTRKSDGMPVSMHLEAENAPLPGGADPARLVLDYKLRADKPSE